MQNHNLSPEEWEFEQQAAAYYEVEQNVALEEGDFDRVEFCRKKRVEALRILGMIGVEQSIE